MIKFFFLFITFISAIAPFLSMCMWIFCGGVLEMFPISSSGHLLLLEKIIFFITHNTTLFMPPLFDHFLHVFPVVIVPIFFYRHYCALLYAPLRSLSIIMHLLMVGIVTELITVFFYWLFNNYLTIQFPLFFGFFISGALLMSLRLIAAKNTARFGLFEAVVLGIGQGIALLPGISRFGITYVSARWLGFIPRKALQVSFLIEWPISLAGFLKGTFDLYHQQLLFELLNRYTLFIMLTAIVAYQGLVWMEHIIMNGKINFFAWYLFIIALVTLYMR